MEYGIALEIKLDKKNNWMEESIHMVKVERFSRVQLFTEGNIQPKRSQDLLPISNSNPKPDLARFQVLWQVSFHSSNTSVFCVPLL